MKIRLLSPYYAGCGKVALRLYRAAATLTMAGSAAARAISEGRIGRSGKPRPGEAGRSPESSEGILVCEVRIKH